MSDDVQTFRVCRNQIEFDILTTALQEADIEFATASNAPSFDLAALGSERANQMVVRIRARDFDRANRAILEQTERELTEVPAGHYVLDYTDQELVELLADAHEWNEFDVACAKLLLRQRGIDLSGEFLAEIQAKRLAVEREGKQGSRVLLIFGCLCGIAGAYYLFGAVLGFLIGWSFRTMKSTDPSGGRYFSYDRRTRFEGGALMAFATLSLLVWGVIRLFLPDVFLGP